MGDFKGISIHGFKNGNYQLVYESRELTDEELAVMPKDELLEPFVVDDVLRECPELIHLTFIPVENLPKAQILRADERLALPNELVLNQLEDFPELEYPSIPEEDYLHRDDDRETSADD